MAKSRRPTVNMKENRFRRAVQNAGAGCFQIDADGCFQWVNEAFLRMYGYTKAEEVIGRHFSMAQVEGDLEKAREIVRQGAGGHGSPRTGIHAETEKRQHWLPGPLRTAYKRRGRIVGVEGFLIDTTAFHQGNAPHQAEEHLAALLESTQDIIWSVDLNYRLPDVQPGIV